MAHVTRTLPRFKAPLAVLPLLAAAALVALPSAWRGDLVSLSPIQPRLMQLDTDLRADLGADESGVLVAVSAPDEAGVLAQAEAAGAALDRLTEQGMLAGYASPAHLLPSPALQRQRLAALPDVATLTARLAQATAGGPLGAERLAPFVADVQAARQSPPLTRDALKGTPLLSALNAQLLEGDARRPWRALLSLQLPAGADPAALGPPLRDALASVPGAQVIHIKGELDALYARYLREARLQALAGAAAVCVLLALHLRNARRLWGMVQPVAAAVLIVLAALTAAGVALGILHLVGLLLTVAIGSNYALFFDQVRAQQDAQPRGQPLALDPDTLASLALANLTAVVSFGMLALSSIPVLLAVGQVVAPGILISLLLSAAFIPARPPR